MRKKEHGDVGGGRDARGVQASRRLRQAHAERHRHHEVSMRSRKPQLSASVAAFASIAHVVIVGCTPNVAGVAKTTVARVVVAGPVNGARVAAYEVNTLGRRGKEVASAKTGDDGTFTIDVKDHFGPTLVCAEGGTYAEEAT